MKFFQSIRWRLQLWYGLLLVLVLSGFGFTTFRWEKDRQLQRLDEELQRRLPLLVKSQRPVAGDRERREFKISPEDAAIFDRKESDSFYYVVWLRNGEPVTRSASAPTEVPKPQQGDPPNRLRGHLRESFVFTGPGDCVLVGRSISADLADLNQLSWWLVGMGGGVLLLGLAGGAWLVSRALSPISKISSTAKQIAVGDLTRRIDTTTSSSELGQLTEVLNSTFARLDGAFTRQAHFTADAAHELRTPLAVMLMHVQNGLDSEGLSDEQREAFEASQRAAQRMRGLTESLLTLARLDSGETSANHVQCDLGDLVKDTVAQLKVLAADQEVTLETDLESVSCMGNAPQLEQVVTNLIRNAIFYNQPGGSVSVELCTKENAAILTVSDTGQGIEAKDLPHIFERFYRADKVRTGTTSRSGLGLAIVQAIVAAHNGSITVDSEHGKGSCFTVSLPRVNLV